MISIKFVEMRARLFNISALIISSSRSGPGSICSLKGETPIRILRKRLVIYPAPGLNSQAVAVYASVIRTK